MNALVDFIPYRGTQKLDKLGLIVDQPPTIPPIRARDVRRTTLHHIHSNGTWMVDYLFLKPNGDLISSLDRTTTHPGRMLTVCCFIHCNSRFVDFYVVQQRTETEYIPAVKELVRKYMDRVTCLISDKEKSFDSNAAKAIYDSYGIKHISYNMSNQSGERPDHLKLAIIDRFARTLRDMIFNSSRSNPNFQLNEQTLKQIITVYNVTPHATLSKIMHFDVSPWEAFKHERLLDEINRRVFMQNYMTTQRFDYLNVQPGDYVYLHKPRRFGEKRRANVEDVPYRVVACRRGGYILEDSHGNVLTETVYIGNQRITRSRIVPRSEIAVAR